LEKIVWFIDDYQSKRSIQEEEAFFWNKVGDRHGQAHVH